MSNRAPQRDAVEVASWRKSSRSGSGGNGANCVEAGAWRKSARSGGGGNGANCIEAGACTCHGIAIRDTKHRDGGILTIDRAEWTTLLTAVNHGDLNL